MDPTCRLRVPLIACLLATLVCAARADAEVLCDPAHQDCRATLLSYIANEHGSIDVAMWFMEDPDMANALIARHRAGVPVRALVDPRRNATTPQNAVILDMLEAAGIPMRWKSSGGILHWKFMVFSGQNVVQFSAANYSDYYFRPATPYLDYTDEGIYFCDDPPIVDSFRRKFDDAWVNTSEFSHYANITGTPARSFPLHPVDPTLNFVPAQDFGRRSTPLYDLETTGIDVIMYKITEPTHADGMIRAVARGVPVRLITEPDLYRNPANIWQAYHVDRMYAAGVQIRVRAHRGFLHQKSVLLYSQDLTIFGSSNWTGDSNRVQYEHNYFTRKSTFFTWFERNFVRKWTNSTGNAETRAFTPLPPDPPVYVSPVNGATGISTTTAVSLKWKPGSWAHRADVYFGTSSPPPLRAANVSVSPGSTKSYALPLLAPNTTYYWRIVSRTAAGQAASGAVRSFTTVGGTPPPPAGDIVLYAAEGTLRGTGWRIVNDTTAAGGRRVQYPNAGAPRLSSALASPASHVELTFTAEAGRPYRLWVRGKADGNSYVNDSAFIQFSNSVNSSGSPVYRIGTTGATTYNLEACSGCGVSGWGWEDNGFGSGVLGPAIYFASTGSQTLRVQIREDGLSIDQIVLSPQTYFTTPPGAARNDTTILPR